MKKVDALIAFFIVVLCLKLGKSLLIPLSLGLLIAFLLTLPVRSLTRFGFPRPLAVVIVQLSMLTLTGTAFWFCINEASDFSGQSPQLEQQMNQRIQSLREDAHLLLRKIDERLRFQSRPANPRMPPSTPAAPDVVTQNLISPVFAIIEHLSLAFVDFLGTAALVFVLSFFLLFSWDELGDRIFLLAGKRRLIATTLMLQEASTGVRRFLLLNFAINLGVGAGFSLILYAFGIPQPVLWGLLAALLRFIPSVGVLLAIIPPLTLSIIIFEGWWEPLLLVLVSGTFDVLVSSLLEPLVYGGGIGVSAIAIILSAVFWTWCWGPIGLILAPPFTICLVVLGRYIPHLEFFSILFGQSSGVETSYRFFHALLGPDEQEAQRMAVLHRDTSDLIDVFDALIIPAIVAAERDLRRGTLSKAKYELILKRVESLMKELAGPAAEQAADSATAEYDVLVIPMKSQSEFLCGQMLEAVLVKRGFRVQVMSNQALLGEAAHYTRENKIPLVILSAIAEDHDNDIRYALKRFESWKGIQPAIVAARWGASPGDPERILPSKLFVLSVATIREIVEKHLRIFPKRDAVAESAVAAAS